MTFDRRSTSSLNIIEILSDCMHNFYRLTTKQVVLNPDFNAIS